MHTYRQKTEFFRNLHQNGNILLLTNIWDPISALLVEHSGAQALATASAAIANSLGYRDGETLSKKQMLDTIERIAAVSELPLSVDIEKGYGERLADLEDTISRLLDLGVCGINIEDSLVEGGELRAVNEQAKRIQHVRTVSERRSIPLFINARTDCFLQPGISSEEALEETLKRAEVFSAAGCHGIFVVGVYDMPTIKLLKKEISLPLNVLLHPEHSRLEELQQAGVNRVSVGPFFMRAVMAAAQHIAQRVLNDGNAQAMKGAFKMKDILAQTLR